MTAASLLSTERKIRRQLRSIGATPRGVRRVAAGTRWDIALAVHHGKASPAWDAVARLRALERWLGVEGRS